MTISEGAAIELATEAGPASPVPREAAEKVLEYLVFHRSLIADRADNSQILERYLGLVQNLREGVHIVISDPFHKATAMLFELVLDEEFDPWEIDLVRFVRAYLDRVRSEGAIDFPVAGRLVCMAWNILYLQSEAVLRSRDTPLEIDSPLDDGSVTPDPSEEGYLGLMQTPEAVDVTSTVLHSDAPPPLVQMVHHPETRPVSLLELIRAFGEAEIDARRSIRQQELRERLSDEQRSPPEVLVHGDIPERDVDDAWVAAKRHPVGEPFPFLSLWRPTEGRERLVAMFLAALYLARERSVEFSQEQILRAPLSLVRMTEERKPLIEEAS